MTSSDDKTTASDDPSGKKPPAGLKTSVIRAQVTPTGIYATIDNPEGEGFIGSVQRYTALIIGMILCGIVMSMALGSMVSLRGDPGPMISLAIDPIWAVLVVFGCLAVCFLIAVVVARIVNPAVGTFVLGAGLGTLSMGSGGYLDILFSGAPGLQIGLETLAWGGMVLLMTAGIYRLTGPLPDQPEADASKSISPREIFSQGSLRAAGAGILAVVAVYLFASNDLKGQSLAAAIIAGVATGYLGRFLAPTIQPILLYAAPCIFLAIGQVVIFGSGTSEVISTWVQNGGPRLGVPTPVDVAAGALMGVSIGIGFSRGIVEAHAAR